MGRRWVSGLVLAVTLAGCGGSGGAVSRADYNTCTELYRLGSMGGDHAPEMRQAVGRIESDDIRQAAQEFVNNPDPDTSRALVKACGDKVPPKP